MDRVVELRCPKCRRLTAKVQSWQTAEIEVKCSRCNELIHFYPPTQKGVEVMGIKIIDNS